MLFTAIDIQITAVKLTVYSYKLTICTACRHYTNTTTTTAAAACVYRVLYQFIFAQTQI